VSDRWNAVLHFGAAVLASGVPGGYVLGRWRPVQRARSWARSHVAFGDPAGRVRSAVVIAVLPDMFVPLLWFRIRHGRYPEPPPRRRAPTPALVERPYRPTEGDRNA
jgi:hypothetical protein